MKYSSRFTDYGGFIHTIIKQKTGDFMTALYHIISEIRTYFETSGLISSFLFYDPFFHKQQKVSRKNRKKKSKFRHLRWKWLVLNKKSGKTKLSFTSWLVNEFFSHHISTQSKPSNIDFPKIVDFRKEEISWKWWSNSELFEKTWLLQESITHPNTVFAAIVNKSLTFNCSIIDVGNTIFF